MSSPVSEDIYEKFVSLVGQNKVQQVKTMLDTGEIDINHERIKEWVDNHCEESLLGVAVINRSYETARFLLEQTNYNINIDPAELSGGFNLPYDLFKILGEDLTEETKSWIKIILKKIETSGVDVKEQLNTALLASGEPSGNALNMADETREYVESLVKDLEAGISLDSIFAEDDTRSKKRSRKSDDTALTDSKFKDLDKPDDDDTPSKDLTGSSAKRAASTPSEGRGGSAGGRE